MTGVVEGPFPRFVAGLPIWGSPAQVAEACTQSGGFAFAFGQDRNEVSLVNVTGDDWVACAPPPVDPFGTFNEVEGIGVKFCEFDGVTACEMVFSFRDRSYADSKELLERIEAKYGPGESYPPEFSCSDHTDRQREFRRTWAFIDTVDGKRIRAGRIVLGFYCSVDSPQGKAAASLVYQNALGFFFRMENAEQRRNSY
jgi:hypothetical protein